MAFKYFASSKRKYNSDCSVRCIMASEGIKWTEAYDMLSAEARREYNMPDDIKVISKVLEKKLNFIPKKAEMLPAGTHKRRMTVAEFANAHSKGTFILSLTGHIVCVKDGNWLDTWDCGQYKVFKYWQKR